MHFEMTSALASERQRELARQRHAVHTAREYGSGITDSAITDSDITSTRTPGRRIPRYRLSWSRTSVPTIGATGRHGRSWVIVISATRGL